MKAAISEVVYKGKIAKKISHELAFLPTSIKNRALRNIAAALIKNQIQILQANKLDYTAAQNSGMDVAMLDRLLLSPERLQAIASDVQRIVTLPDPVGEIIEQYTLPNKLNLIKKRVPLGVIGAIYESRPNVTVDISVLCLKAGNAVILRGGKEAINSNKALVEVIQHATIISGVPQGAIQFIESTDKKMVDQMLKLREYIDLLIPRGGQGLINLVKTEASMPVVTGGIGVCHAYIDQYANLKKAVAIVYNAKVQRPTVCNALDTILIHRNIAAKVIPLLGEELTRAKVEMHCDPVALKILKPIQGLKLKAATSEDWGKEFLSLTCAIKTVDSLDEALQHIEKYGSGHSEAIITQDKKAANRFLNEVDAACVYSNASTRFTDGGQFGLGAEIGISTQKFHARGPMALREITSYKWIIVGNGQIRP